MVQDQDRIREVVSRFIDKAGAKYPIEKIVLYGSYVRGTADKWSDIDLAVVTPAFDTRKQGMRELFYIAKPISVDLEPIPVRPEIFANPPTASFAYEIKRTGVVIYDRDNGGMLI